MFGLVKYALFAVCLSVFLERTDGFSLYNGTETNYNNSSDNFSHNELISQNEEQESERVKYLINVNKLVWLIFAPVLLTIGLIGNTLSILVLRR